MTDLRPSGLQTWPGNIVSPCLRNKTKKYLHMCKNKIIPNKTKKKILNSSILVSFVKMLVQPVWVTFLIVVTVIRYLTNVTQGRRAWFISGLKGIKSILREGHMAGHMTSILKKHREMSDVGQSAFSFPFSSGQNPFHRMLSLTFSGSLSSSSKLSEDILTDISEVSSRQF